MDDGTCNCLYKWLFYPTISLSYWLYRLNGRVELYEHTFFFFFRYYEVSDSLSKIYAVKISCTQNVKTTNSKRGNNVLRGITYLFKLYNSKREHLQHRRQIGGMVRLLNM